MTELSRREKAVVRAARHRHELITMERWKRWSKREDNLVEKSLYLACSRLAKAKKGKK